MTKALSFPGKYLRESVSEEKPIPFIGVYDVFSASIAARHYNGLFVSGFSFAASHYGLPDIGFISWSDIVSFVQRLRTLLPRHHIIVDIDDGYCDTEVACHVVRQLEALYVSGVILEDQQRPRCCGHVNGKQIMELDAYLQKLQQVLDTRNDLFVIARTDAAEEQEAIRRAHAFAELGADAILIDAVTDLNILRSLKDELNIPIMFNQMAGGKSPRADFTDLLTAGVNLINYSTPGLFAAQAAVEEAMVYIKNNNGYLPQDSINVTSCNQLLHENLAGIDVPEKS